MGPDPRSTPAARILIVAAAALGIGSPAPVQAQDAGRSAPPDFVLAIRYEERDPARTFQSRAYDVRKGEYVASRMAAWVKQVKAGRPGTTAYLKEVRLIQEAGRTEAEKLASALKRERTRAASTALKTAPGHDPSRASPRRKEAAPRREVPVRRRSTAPPPGLAGTQWGFRLDGPPSYEFLPDGQMKHHTTSRVASGGWKQDGDKLSLWVGPRREEPDFLVQARVHGDRLEGRVKSRMFPGQNQPALKDRWTPEVELVLHRMSPRAVHPENRAPGRREPAPPGRRAESPRGR